jgi:diaminopimelate epimerase
MQFTKMHGAGNDYIYVDCFSEPIPSDPSELARSMADRHFGVGGDGLVLICPHPDAAAEMRMYNSDGSYSENCGNALRCVAKYVYEHGIARRNPLLLVTAGHTLQVHLTLDGERVLQAEVDMGAPILTARDIPTHLTGDPPINQPLEAAGYQFLVTSVSMGNPHCVAFVDQLHDDLVLGAGPAIEVCELFPRRVNVEFVEVLDRQTVRQRTWERGAGETLACGTGACAVCVAGVLAGKTDRKITVQLRGGDLQIHWREQDNHVLMTGPAAEVFTGVWHGALKPPAGWATRT